MRCKKKADAAERAGLKDAGERRHKCAEQEQGQGQGCGAGLHWVQPCLFSVSADAPPGPVGVSDKAGRANRKHFCGGGAPSHTTPCSHAKGWGWGGRGRGLAAPSELH